MMKAAIGMVMKTGMMGAGMRAQVLAGSVLMMLVGSAFCLSLLGIWTGIGGGVLAHVGQAAGAYSASANAVAAMQASMQLG